VAEIWFYHLQSQPLERALPALIEKALERGWRVGVQTVDDLRVKALDDLLWAFAPESFLPHTTAGDRSAAVQPIVVARDDANPNDAQLRIFVQGAELTLAPDSAYLRAILLFDGGNDAELDAARRQWSQLKGANAALAYWRQSDAGRWERQT
jgi:DNA polymerase III subunit chi